MSQTVLYILLIIACLLVSCNGSEDLILTPTEQVEEDPPNFVAVEKSPIAIKTVEPGYPELVKELHLEGTVWVKLLITKSGTVRKAVIMKSDAEIFNQPCILAGVQWEFTPAILKNKLIEVWAVVPFKFSL